MSEESSALAEKLIQHFEGFRSKPYLDSIKVPTVGFGCVYYADGRKVTLQDPPISLPKALALLEHRLNTEFKPAIERAIHVPTTPNQMAAILSFAWNVGVHNFEKSGICRKLNQGDIQGAADDFDRWVTAGGRIIKGLVTRRTAEKEVFLGESDE